MDEAEIVSKQGRKKVLEKGKTKTKGPEKKLDHSEVGGHKRWVLAILVLTVILGLLFSMKSGLPTIELGMPNVSGLEFNLDLFGSRVYQF